MLYTRTGDDGTTSDGRGRRVPKDAAIIEAGGDVDELACHVGLLIAAAPPTWHDELHDVQRRLFAIGAYVAGYPAVTYFPDAALVQQMERAIDALQVPFAGFILPGGCEAAARAHVCRTVCRRAERHALSAGATAALPYLNRLSDYFFAMALRLNADAGQPETYIP